MIQNTVKFVDELQHAVQASAKHFIKANAVPSHTAHLIEVAMTMGAVMGIQHTIARYSQPTPVEENKQ